MGEQTSNGDSHGVFARVSVADDDDGLVPKLEDAERGVTDSDDDSDEDGVGNVRGAEPATFALPALTAATDATGGVSLGRLCVGLLVVLSVACAALVVVNPHSLLAFVSRHARARSLFSAVAVEPLGVYSTPLNSTWEAFAARAAAFDFEESDAPTAAESEAAFILTGDRNAAAALSAPIRSALRLALSAIAFALLTVRPVLQHELWLTDCSSYLPCPSPNAAVRRAHPNASRDAHVVRQLEQLPAFRTHSLDFLLASPPSPAPLFHSASADPQRRFFVPGETAEEQELAMRFQSDLHARQHPANCSAVERIMVMDYFHSGGGVGSWSHARAVALAVGVRAGRLVIEAYDLGGYAHAYSDCTRRKGLGGCDMFLPASPCALPDDWGALVEQDAQEWQKAHPTVDLARPTTLHQRIELLKDRRMLRYTELKKISPAPEPNELHHLPQQLPGWEREQLAHLPEPLQYLRDMPECWWSRQALSYHFRLTQTAERRLLTLVAQSLQLPDPNTTAANAVRYADAVAPAPTHTAHWWLAIQAVKLEWQIHQLNPALVNASRNDLAGVKDAAAAAAWSSAISTRAPLLGYTFIRHGDKALEGSALFADDRYLEFMRRVAHRQGLWTWYVGADDLMSPERMRGVNNASAEPLRFHTSVLVDSISAEERQRHPLSAGFSWWTMFTLTDAHREAVMWRTVLEFAMGQVADVIVSTLSSNHPRMLYELATAVSDARATTPFLGLDSSTIAYHVKLVVELSKNGTVPGC